ncbi:MAG: hypothetical protein KA155_00660 [Alphaproteobacteria bacterium]|jgi:sugar-specific transcriptional regulator TrmB|nr:hypothetical protein [Alphaproteobacteria bacterium]
MIDELFQTLGFKEEEVKTYLALLDHGARTGGDLAKIMGAARPTTYGYLERLMAGGLVTQSQRRGVKIFIPEPAEKIRLLYRRKIEELRGKEKSLDAVIPELEKRSGANLFRPRMQFFEGREGIESALTDILNVPAGTMTLSFWPIKATIDATSPEFFHYLNAERIRRDIHVQAIWPRTQVVYVRNFPFMGAGKGFKREIRIAPESVEFKMGYWICGNRVVYISSRAESYGFIMESAELAQTMATQHQVIWGISEKLEFDEKHTKNFLREIEEEF